MIATIQRNENEYMTVDLSKVKDDDLIEECNERQISVYDDEMMALFEAIYHAKANNQCYAELVSKLIDKTLGRIL